MSTVRIDLNGEEWDVEFTYSAGTHFLIHSASLEPNDPEEMEIEGFTHHTLPLCDEFLTDYLEANGDAIEQLVWDHING